MIVYHLQYAFHQNLIVTFYLFLFNHIFLLKNTRVFTFESLILPYQVINNHMQLVHIKRFRQESIGPFLQAFQAIGNSSLRGKHHYWDMIQAHIGLNHSQQRKAVHLGHHHIAHHQVELLLGFRKQQAQGLTTAGYGGDMIVAAQLLSDIATYLLIVVNNHHSIV